MTLKEQISRLYEKTGEYNQEDRKIFDQFKEQLNQGLIRAAEKKEGHWSANIWVKKGVLVGFRMGKTIKMSWSAEKHFYDKDTYPERHIDNLERFRLVPGGSSIRDGSYIGKGVTIMPPAYINTGAFIDDNTLIDSHALVGSCAQIGKNVHLSAAAIIGGVIEPIGQTPVIVEDNVFIGGNCGIYEGVIVGEAAILAAGVILTSSTKVYDAVNDTFLTSTQDTPLTIPPRAVVIQGTRQLSAEKGIAIYCPVIIKYRDSKSDSSVQLEKILRF